MIYQSRRGIRMRWLSILILVLFLITVGCVSPPADGGSNSTNSTPTTSIPTETANPGATDNSNTGNSTPTENTTPTEGPTTYTLEDVSTHAQPSDCWTAINGKVYNLTEFVNGHPGGPGIISACGIDGTTLFTTRNGNGPHPASATKTIEKYYIGELK